jgi:putative ABC transport system permease protein
MSDFTIILRSMSARLFSTVTTVITVAVAVALMLALLSMRHSGERAFERGAGNAHMIVSAEESPLLAVLNGVFYAGAPRQALSWAKYEEIARSHPWEFAIPTQLGDSHRGYPVMATTPEFFDTFQPHPGVPWRVSEGRLFERSFEVVVGSSVARATGIAIGDRFDITHGIDRSRGFLSRGEVEGPAPHVHYGFTYTVVGILEPTGSAHDRAMFTNLESSWIIHAHDRRRTENPAVRTTTADDLADADRQITGIYLRVATRPGRALAGVQQQVYNTLRADTAITVADPHHEVRKLFAIVSNIDQVFLAMAAVVLVSSGVGIMLALYNSMDQRRRQVAILRVLGAGRWRVFGLVLTESALIGLLGAVAGVALCALALRIVADVMMQRLGLGIEAGIEPLAAFVVVLGTILLASLSGLFPAALAYRTAVVRHLRPLG